ncbi:Protein ALTERED XYLOGLUCAN 4 [Bienertia sinuspersici]
MENSTISSIFYQEISSLCSLCYSSISFASFYLYPTPPLLESPTKDHFSYLTPILIPSSSSGQKSGNEVLDSVSVTLKEKETGNENLLQESKEIGNENLLPESKEIGKENLLPELKETVNENSHSESTLPPEAENESKNENLPQQKGNEIPSTCDYTNGEWVQDNKGPLDRKTTEQNFNRLFFESIDESWGSDLNSIDMVVLSVGHWYLHPAIYRDGDLELGCHAVDTVNCTETEFYGVYGKAFNTSLKTIIERKLGKEGNGIDVIVTTFSPHHFEGDWDKFGACPKTKPYMEVEKSLEGMDAQMRDKQVEEVEKAKELLNVDNNALSKVRVAALDVTKLALLRPDGHPGPYMYANPFADGIKERVHNDCVHWCLPGPIDTWNEIMLDIDKLIDIISYVMTKQDCGAFNMEVAPMKRSKQEHSRLKLHFARFARLRLGGICYESV